MLTLVISGEVQKDCQNLFLRDGDNDDREIDGNIYCVKKHKKPSLSEGEDEVARRYMYVVASIHFPKALRSVIHSHLRTQTFHTLAGEPFQFAVNIN